jgi:hypothetical protein
MFWRKSKPVPLPLPLPEVVQEVMLEPLMVTPLKQVAGQIRLPSAVIAELRTACKRECEQQALRASSLEELHKAQGARELFERFLNFVGEVKS